MKTICLLSLVAFAVIAPPGTAATGPWEQPAAALAEEIAGILGPGQAQLVLRNLSNIPDDEMPAIRGLLEQDLKAHGVLVSGQESANSIRVTLSENLRERLWVAEVAEGSETRVVMIHVDRQAAIASASQVQMMLRKERLFVAESDNPVLAATETNAGLLVLYPDQLISYVTTAGGTRAQTRLQIKDRPRQARDPRGLLLNADRGLDFTAFLPGVQCTGNNAVPGGLAAGTQNAEFRCHESDDPWPIDVPGSADGVPGLKAFYNAARNYFTGVVTPSLSVDLPPFYMGILVPRPSGAGLLIGGIDGKVQIVEGGTLKPIAGTRDWGNDFVLLLSGCGSGAQIVASGSGEAITDSLRAYGLPAFEAVPASPPLAMEGTVTALASASDGKSLLAVVRKQGSEGQEDSYEVDRVTATCN